MSHIDLETLQGHMENAAAAWSKAVGCEYHMINALPSFDYAALPDDVDLAAYNQALIQDITAQLSPAEAARINEYLPDNLDNLRITQDIMRQSADDTPAFAAFWDAFTRAAPKESYLSHDVAAQVDWGGLFHARKLTDEFKAVASYANVIVHKPRMTREDVCAADPSRKEGVSSDLFVDCYRDVEREGFIKTRIHEGVHGVQFATVPYLHVIANGEVQNDIMFWTDAAEAAHMLYLMEVDAYFKAHCLQSHVRLGARARPFTEEALTQAKRDAYNSTNPTAQSIASSGSAAASYLLAKNWDELGRPDLDTASFARVMDRMASRVVPVALTEADIRKLGASATAGQYNTFTEGFLPDAPLRDEFKRLTSKEGEELSTLGQERSFPMSGVEARSLQDWYSDDNNLNDFMVTHLQGKDRHSTRTRRVLAAMS